ncbi:MAG: efflux RND transporter periplasmic adaptor subunit [Steroidobacteraceae bacterium]
MQHRARLLMAGVMFVLGATPLLSSCSRAVAVSAVTVESGSVRASVSNTRAGTIDACRRAKLAPATGGQIAKLRVHKGDRVKAGEVLIELWNEDLRAQLDLTVKDAAAAIERGEQACATARVARAEAERWKSMLEQKLVAVDAAQRVIGEADADEAACRAANLGIKSADARVNAARATLERTRIRAPFDGTVAEINGELGEFVTPSPVGIPTPPSVDLIDNSCLYITAPIDEVDAPQIRAGMPARITLDAFPGRSFDGHVRRVAPYVLDAEKQARTVEIEAEIDSKDGRASLLPGYSADVEVILAVHENVLRVPTPALIEGKYVLLIDPSSSKATKRAVEKGIGNWDYTEILGGLKAGDRIVTSIDRAGVADGVKVKVEEAGAQPPRS